MRGLVVRRDSVDESVVCKDDENEGGIDSEDEEGIKDEGRIVSEDGGGIEAEGRNEDGFLLETSILVTIGRDIVVDIMCVLVGERDSTTADLVDVANFVSILVGK